MPIEILHYAAQDGERMQAFFSLKFDGWLVVEGLGLTRTGEIVAPLLRWTRGRKRYYRAAIRVEGDDLRTLLIGEIRAALDKHLATLPENERVVPYVRRPRVAPAACAPRVVRTQPLAFRSALRPPVASGGSR
jgi:hypothetical protein